MADSLHEPDSSLSPADGPDPPFSETPHRFVVLHHRGYGDDHWDVMFERDGVLATWRCPVPLSQVGLEPVALTRIGDHRLAYLDYEGPISGGRGRVERVERGDYTRRIMSPDRWQIAIRGEHTRGTFDLWRIDDSPAEWRLGRASEFTEPE